MRILQQHRYKTPRILRESYKNYGGITTIIKREYRGNTARTSREYCENTAITLGECRGNPARIPREYYEHAVKIKRTNKRLRRNAIIEQEILQLY